MTNKFSKRSLQRLETCQPGLQILFNKVIKVIDCTVICGRRAKKEQNLLFDADLPRTRCKWPHSKHNVLSPTALSQAIDVAPYYKERPHIRWDKKSLWRWYFFNGIVRGIAEELNIPIRQGCDWDRDSYVRDQKFNDLPHTELFIEEV